MFRIESCAKQQVWIDDMSEERASAQIQIEQPSDFRWRLAKAWKRCQEWFWIDHNQSLQPNRWQVKCDIWKPCSDQPRQDELRPIYVECDKTYRSRFAFKNSGILCVALILKLKNPSTAVLYAKKSVAGGEILQVLYRFFKEIDMNLWASA